LRGALLEDDDLPPNSSAAPAATSPAPVTGALPPEQTGPDASSRLIAIVMDSLEDDKAEDITRIDLRGRSNMADWMVIASGRSARQVLAISEHLAERVKHRAAVNVRTEGRETGDWVLIDAGDVIVHVFRPEVREFYQLEQMWLAGGAAAPQG